MAETTAAPWTVADLISGADYPKAALDLFGLRQRRLEDLSKAEWAVLIGALVELRTNAERAETFAGEEWARRFPQ